MPKVDFSKIDDVQDFSPLPAGKYPCKLVEVEEARTQYDDEMWKLRFQVASGQYAGRFIFDNLVFSEAAIKRAKLICSRMGINVSGELNLTTDMLKGRACQVTVDVEDYEDKEGKTKKRNVVPFAGYERSGQTDEAAESQPEEAEVF